jgi:hypothetical protein
MPSADRLGLEQPLEVRAAQDEGLVSSEVMTEAE